MSYYSQPTQSDPWRFSFGVLAGLLLAGSVWAVWWLLDHNEDPPREDSSSTTVQASPSGPTSSPGPAIRETCQAVLASQAEPLQTGAASLEQWEVHIGAMNKLVTGAITLDQATAFWENTRMGAHARLERFHAAEGGYAARTTRCPGPGSLPGGADLQSCAVAVAARHRALQALGTALATWEVHVHHMDMLRAGRLSPEQAQLMWLASWRSGVHEVHAYQAAQREARGLHC